jgi:hypothetical protein
MVVENPSWGEPRIHGELRMLGFELSERTISRWMNRAPRDPHRAKRWLTFLRNHREAIAATDFFTVPTITFGVLYCFFVISHDRRRILHVNVTKHPTGGWITQQLREPFPLSKKLLTSSAHRSISPSSSRRRATASTASQRILTRCFRASCGGHRRATETWTEGCGGKHCLGPGSDHRNATVEHSLGLCHVWVVLVFVP